MTFTGHGRAAPRTRPTRRGACPTRRDASRTTPRRTPCGTACPRRSEAASVPCRGRTARRPPSGRAPPVQERRPDPHPLHGIASSVMRSPSCVPALREAGSGASGSVGGKGLRRFREAAPRAEPVGGTGTGTKGGTRAGTRAGTGARSCRQVAPCSVDRRRSQLALSWRHELATERAPRGAQDERAQGAHSGRHESASTCDATWRNTAACDPNTPATWRPF